MIMIAEMQRTLDGYFGQRRHDGSLKHDIVVQPASDDDAPLVQRSVYMNDEAMEVSGSDFVSSGDDDDDSFVVDDHHSDSGDGSSGAMDDMRNVIASLRSRRRYMSNADCPKCAIMLRAIEAFMDKISALFDL